jgi:hypothetical protein
MSAHGLGAVISGATADGNYPLLLEGTLSVIVTLLYRTDRYNNEGNQVLIFALLLIINTH